MELKSLFGFILMFLLISCGYSEQKRQEKLKFDAETKSNEKKFYYPEPYDNWWRSYQPNLENSEGWIKNNCDEIYPDSLKVLVLRQSISHKSWGFYKGTLDVRLLDNGKEIQINFDCFIPDLKKGEWLNNTQ
ncbi:hypothetical protein UMM65_03290 [Aureibaculum sp. 2210JD6-5]|uniref:hypothetical protein n=1 Tax=Aureibaculum sp. 2210JD6-5 TaxID=3103957 RepID=UPI002AADD071|nr:hypothetical protein [Aureibaculum sp. 2210JD6-5]MDY7394251.1 hypothetical protein [Aureibaculum sp. 2210JD6-5]